MHDGKRLESCNVLFMSHDKKVLNKVMLWVPDVGCQINRQPEGPLVVASLVARLLVHQAGHHSRKRAENLMLRSCKALQNLFYGIGICFMRAKNTIKPGILSQCVIGSQMPNYLVAERSAASFHSSMHNV